MDYYRSHLLYCGKRPLVLYNHLSYKDHYHSCLLPDDPFVRLDNCLLYKLNHRLLRLHYLSVDYELRLLQQYNRLSYMDYYRLCLLDCGIHRMVLNNHLLYKDRYHLCLLRGDLFVHLDNCLLYKLIHRLLHHQNL